MNDTIDWEMGVNSAHFVLETFRNSNYEVIDQRPNRTQACVVLSCSIPHLEKNFVPLLRGDVHRDMSDVLSKGSARARYVDDTGLDVDSDALRHLKLLGLNNILHLSRGRVVGLKIKVNNSASCSGHPRTVKTYFLS